MSQSVYKVMGKNGRIYLPRELQSEMEDIIGNNLDLNADDAETSFAFGYQPTPKEDIHEKSPHAQAAATAQNIASGIDALGRKKDSLNEDIRSNDSKIASIGEEIAMDNEQIASMKAEKQAIQAEQNEQKKRGDTPSAEGYARIRELAKRSIRGLSVWKNSPGSEGRMPGRRKKLGGLMLYRPGPAVRSLHPEVAQGAALAEWEAVSRKKSRRYWISMPPLIILRLRSLRIYHWNVKRPCTGKELPKPG